MLRLLCLVETELADYLSALEGLSANAVRAAIEHVPSLRNPFDPEPVPDFMLLIELESSGSRSCTGLDLPDALNRLLEAHFGTLVANAVVGNGSELWHLRHSLSEGTRMLGRTIAFDVSVPRSRIIAFRRDAGAILQREFPQVMLADFGHIGDGGLHFNVIWPHDARPAWSGDAAKSLRDRLYDLVVRRFEGSFRAEHGIGPHNIDYYRRYTDDAALAIAGGIRQLVDPFKLCGSVDFGPAASTGT